MTTLAWFNAAICLLLLFFCCCFLFFFLLDECLLVVYRSSLKYESNITNPPFQTHSLLFDMQLYFTTWTGISVYGIMWNGTRYFLSGDDRCKICVYAGTKSFVRIELLIWLVAEMSLLQSYSEQIDHIPKCSVYFTSMRFQSICITSRFISLISSHLSNWDKPPCLKGQSVWTESSLSAWRKPGPLATHWVHSEDSDFFVCVGGGGVEGSFFFRKKNKIENSKSLTHHFKV